MTWQSEHGADYEVPAEITQLTGIVDHSWHNDVCPRFCITEDGSGPNLWVEHPDPNRREYGPDAHRFLIIVQMGEINSSDDQAVYEGDDLPEAVAHFKAAALAWAARN